MFQCLLAINAFDPQKLAQCLEYIGTQKYLLMSPSHKWEVVNYFNVDVSSTLVVNWEV